jgi:two-component system, sensor histidine kinase YesM
MRKINQKSMGKAMKKFIKGLSQYLNNMRIKKQLLITYFFAVMIPILLLGSYLVYSTRNLVLQQQISDTKSENIRVENVLKQMTDVASNISGTIFFDSELRDIISKDYFDEISFVDTCTGYTKLGTLLQNYSEISGINIYFENDTIYDTNHFKRITSDTRRTDWYKKSSQTWDIFWMTTHDIDGSEHLSLIRRIPTNDKNKIAILVINISQNYLYSMVKDNSLKTIAAVKNGSIFISNSYEDFGKPINYEVPSGSKQSVQRIKYNSSQVLAVLDILKPSTSNDKFSIITINSSAFKRTNDVTFICYIILIISLVVPFLIILFYSNQFSRRINLLRSEMNNAAGGNLDILSNPGGNDEISELYTDLNLMIDDVKKLLNEVYMEKLIKARMINSQQKIEFKMLASQINPHFLYNTLETIRMKLICNGDRETANVIKILGKTIRRMLEVKDEVVTLDSELEYIRYYLEIQQFRFGSRIEYEIKIDEKVNTKGFYLLPLLLQPIVENAFVHGLEDKADGGKITIDVQKKDKILQILVEDNGNGMAQEKCDFLNSSIRDMEKNSINNSIGLCNVHQRIELYYGRGYGLNIISRIGVGTKVYINLPSDGEVLVDYEGTDH